MLNFKRVGMGLLLVTMFVTFSSFALAEDADIRSPQKGAEFYPDNATEIPANYESYLPKPEVKYTNMAVPSNRNAVAYMYYTAITSKGSPQYKLQTQAYTDELGFRRVGEYYLIAMGQYYGRTGDKLLVTLASGLQYKVMIGDSKAKPHTTNGYKVGLDGSIVEFIADKKLWKHSNLDPFRASIISIQKEIN